MAGDGRAAGKPAGERAISNETLSFYTSGKILSLLTRIVSPVPQACAKSFDVSFN